ncbi:MAG: hypothetical protein WC810_22700 [Janthinobacterium sp.]|jgi:hypothetical protein
MNYYKVKYIDENFQEVAKIVKAFHSQQALALAGFNPSGDYTDGWTVAKLQGEQLAIAIANESEA